jgi:hypothetical protein
MRVYALVLILDGCWQSRIDTGVGCKVELSGSQVEFADKLFDREVVETVLLTRKL